MGDKTSDVTPKREKQSISNEAQVLKTEYKDNEPDKKESVTKNTESNTNTEAKSQNSDEIVKSNDNKVLKRKVTEDGVIIERVLSEGETSSGFETVSSIDSKVDIDDLDLNSSIDEDDYNIVVKVKNELAFQYKNKPLEIVSYHETSSKTPGWQNHRSDRFSNECTSSRRSSFRNSREDKYWRTNVDKNYNYDRRDRESTNNEHSRRRNSNKDWSSRRDHVKSSSRRGRWDEQDSRSKRSRSYDNDRFKSSRSPDRGRNKSLNHKDTKTDTRSSRSFDKNSTKSSPERSSPPRKKRREAHTSKVSSSSSSSSSVWKRLEKRKSPGKKSENDKKSSRKSVSPRRKKERTPFLVELERKLKTIKPSKSLQKESNESTEQVKASESVMEPTLPPAPNQSYQCSYPVMNMTAVPYVQGVVYPPMPTVSVNNLPLVPGPTGLPVHVLPTGEQIPHDMDGRLIPVGPNGHYLPVDPTGRLFAHIVSPENQAVPIHMTEDGVIRLPNSEPVPYGPEHQLPVNIDGRVIPIGPDSTPLYPCPDLPKRCPVEMLYRVGEVHSATTMPQLPQPPPPPPPPPQAGSQETQTFAQTKTTETQTEDQVNLQSQMVDLKILKLTQKPSSLETNKEESLNKYKKKAQDKEKYLEDNPSKGGVKRSIPVKLSRKKPAKDDTENTIDVVSGFGDSDSASKPEMEQRNGDPVDEIKANSDDEQDILEIVCDNEVPKSLNLETKFEDYITDKVQQAVKLLHKKKHTPPMLGRFIISDLNLLPVVYDSPNESPLLRNRFQLSFLTPNIPLRNQPITIKESNVNFKFLPQKTNSTKGEKQPGIKEKLPIFTVDFATQCDFTSDAIKNLNFTVTRLETEISRLKRINSNLFNDYMNVQSAKQKKSEELRKALLEIQDKEKEIQSLKSSK